MSEVEPEQTSDGSRLPSIDFQDADFREWLAGFGFALPYLLIAGLFLFGPLLLGLYMSFYEWNPIFPAESEFIGLENYRTLINDPRFWNALGNTIYFVILTVPTIVIMSLLLALGVNREVKGRWVLRMIFFSPYVITVAVIGLLWQDLFSQNGLIPYYLRAIGINTGDWLTSPELAMPAIVIATIWWTLAFNFVVLLAARQNVSERLYEAARLDGASSWRMMIDITIPRMKNPLIFVIITTFVASFQVFGQPFIMTQGGPSFTTTTIVMYLYQTAFSSGKFGYAAAVGYVLFMILIVVSATNFYFLGGDDS